VTEDEKFLRHAAHEFEEGFNTGDVDRLMHFYGDTYVDVNLTNPVQSKAERRAYYAQVMARPGIRLKIQPDDIMIHDDLAFVRGTIFLSQGNGTDGTKQTQLRYLEIWERTEDKTWRAIWGMDGPIQEYAARATDG